MKQLRFFLFFCCCLPLLGSEGQVFTRPPDREITVEAQPLVKNCVAEPFFVGSFIYWHVKEDGLMYALSGFGDRTRSTDKGKVHEPDFDSEPGFKVGAGLNIGHDGWDVYLQYTWIRSQVDDRVHSAEARLGAVWAAAPSSFVSRVSDAKANWDFHFNVLDLEWGRSFYISRFLILRPFCGFKGFWSDQDYDVDYAGFNDDTLTVSAFERAKIEQDVWGFGIRAGLNTAWHLTNNWSFFGDLALAATWGQFDVDRKNTFRDAADGVDVTTLHIEYDRHAMTPILELGVGLRWEIWFSDDSYHFALDVGWEEQMWWDFNRIFHVFDPSSILGNLNFQGLTLKARFDF